MKASKIYFPINGGKLLAVRRTSSGHYFAQEITPLQPVQDEQKRIKAKALADRLGTSTANLRAYFKL